MLGQGHRIEESSIESLVSKAQGEMRWGPEKEYKEEPELKLEAPQWSGGSRIRTTPELPIIGEDRAWTSMARTILQSVVGYSHTRGGSIVMSTTLGSATGVTNTLLGLRVTERTC